jgi:hypothetical protein
LKSRKQTDAVWAVTRDDVKELAFPCFKELLDQNHSNSKFGLLAYNGDKSAKDISKILKEK